MNYVALALKSAKRVVQDKERRSKAESLDLTKALEETQKPGDTTGVEILAMIISLNAMTESDTTRVKKEKTVGKCLSIAVDHHFNEHE